MSQTNEILKGVRKPTTFNTIQSFAPRHNYQMDIIVYNRYKIHNYQYILCIVDVYSRYAHCVALTNMKADYLLDKIKQSFKLLGKPNNLNCDNQFNNNVFNKYFKENQINTYFSVPDDYIKNSIVERFNRTVSNLIQHYRLEKNNYDWPTYLSSIVDKYNNTVHSTTKRKPIDLWKGKTESEQKIKVIPLRFKVGDHVRIRVDKSKFSKGDVINWTREIYKITGIDANRYEVSDSNNKKIGLYREYDLQLTKLTNAPVSKSKEQIQHEQTQRERLTLMANKRTGLDSVNYSTDKPKRITKKVTKLNL